MKGTGISYGAISVLNAIPCGIGSTIGISLKTKAEFYESKNTNIEIKRWNGIDKKLAEFCVQKTLQKLGKTVKGYNLVIDSEIPPSVGLKSSSSVTNAIVMAIINYYESRESFEEILKFASEISKESGYSETGAYDDACGCHYGGLVLTDNTKNLLLYRKNIPKYDVVIIIPDKQRKRADAQELKKQSQIYERMIGKVASELMETITKNGESVGKIIGDDSEIQKKALQNGALATCVSGNGPAVAIIAEKGKGKEIAEKIGKKYILTKTRPMCLAFGKNKIDGFAKSSPSKSYTHRAIILSCLAKGKSTIENPLLSGDTENTMAALRSMGARITIGNKIAEIESDGLHAPKETIDVGNSGTAMRLLSGICSTFEKETTIDGDESVRKRPMADLLDALKNCGVQCSSQDGKAPIKIKGPIKTTKFSVDGKISSQFVSSLLLISPVLNEDSEINVGEKMVSKPYVEMTIECMKKFGVAVERKENTFFVKKQNYAPVTMKIPGDWSSMAYPLVAAALAGKVTIEEPADNVQGDRAILEILEKTGCKITRENGKITCERPIYLSGAEIDISDTPDLFPIVAVLLSTAMGKSRIYGGKHLKFKESNRIKTTVKMLRYLGADINEKQDGCVINGVDALTGGTVNHYSDHRIMMSASVASLVSDGPVFVEDDSCWKVSYPDFVETMKSLGARM